MRPLLLGSLCLVTLSPVIADEYDLTGMMRPGLWEVTSQQVLANGEAGPAETDQDCVTLDDLDDFSTFARSDDEQNVTVEEFERGDDHVRYRMSFASEDPEVDVGGTLIGDMKFDGPERYRGSMKFTMDFQGQSIESHTKMDAHRIGECGDEG